MATEGVMRARRCWFPVLLGALIGVLPGHAVQEDVGADLDRNRRLLERWKADPEHYDRLMHDLRAFAELPPDRQESMRKLDRALHHEDLTTQTRLWTVLSRYRAWMDTLTPADREDILSAPTARERLARIRTLKERQWVDRLPAKVRAQLNRLPADKRTARITELRAEERALRLTWLTRPGQKPAPPRPPSTQQLPPEVQRFVQHHLLPRLGAKEKEQLRQAEGKWPELPRTILALSERYPVLPPLPGKPITHFRDLPPWVKNQVSERRVKKQEGKWPEFALAVVRSVRKSHPRAPLALGACRPADFPRQTRAFLEERLPGLLDGAVRQGLEKLEGRWPDYPHKLHQLARQKRFVIPGMSLPGPRELWESARAHLPDIPDRTLYQFVVTELTAKERAALGISIDDPAGSREKVKKAYYRKNARELQRRGFDMTPFLDEVR
jgi:hypothetical protein